MSPAPPGRDIRQFCKLPQRQDPLVARFPIFRISPLLAGKGGGLVFDRTGQHLGTFATPDQPTNCAFGDADGKTLFITARPSLYRVRLTVPGVKVQ